VGGRHRLPLNREGEEEIKDLLDQSTGRRGKVNYDAAITRSANWVGGRGRENGSALGCGGKVKRGRKQALH